MEPKIPLFFTPDFKIDLVWKGISLQVGSIRPNHQNKISEGIHDLSAQSIRFRFQGSKKESSHEELHYLTELDGINHYAIGIQELSGLERGIAVVRLVRSFKQSEEGEVAVTIIDEYQRMGLGTFLLRLIILAAFERGIHRLSFTFMPDNEGIKRLIHHVGKPYPGLKGHDSTQLFLNLKDMDLEFIKFQLEKTLPEIGSFRLKT